MKEEKGVHLRIDSPKLSGRGARIYLNDMDITNACRDIHIAMPLAGPQMVTIQFYAARLDIEGSFLAELIQKDHTPCAS